MRSFRQAVDIAFEHWGPVLVGEEDLEEIRPIFFEHFTEEFRRKKVAPGFFKNGQIKAWTDEHGDPQGFFAHMMKSIVGAGIATLALPKFSYILIKASGEVKLSIENSYPPITLA